MALKPTIFVPVLAQYGEWIGEDEPEQSDCPREGKEEAVSGK